MGIAVLHRLSIVLEENEALLLMWLGRSVGRWRDKGLCCKLTVKVSEWGEEVHSGWYAHSESTEWIIGWLDLTRIPTGGAKKGNGELCVREYGAPWARRIEWYEMRFLTTEILSSAATMGRISPGRRISPCFLSPCFFFPSANYFLCCCFSLWAKGPRREVLCCQSFEQNMRFEPYKLADVVFNDYFELLLRFG